MVTVYTIIPSFCIRNGKLGSSFVNNKTKTKQSQNYYNMQTYTHILQYIQIINTTTCNMHNDQTSKLEHSEKHIY